METVFMLDAPGLVLRSRRPVGTLHHSLQYVSLSLLRQEKF